MRLTFTLSLTNMPQHGKSFVFLPFPQVSREDPKQAPTEVAPSTPARQEGEAPSIPDTPHFEPDQGDPSPEIPVVGVAIKIEAKERMTQTPPLLSRLIQGYLDHTGMEACPYHQMDHGVRDPDCDFCKRALGPLYHRKIKGKRHLPIFTFNSPISKSGKTHFSLQMEAEDSVATKHTRVLLLSPELSRLTQPAFLLLKRDPAPVLAQRRHITNLNLES